MADHHGAEARHWSAGGTQWATHRASRAAHRVVCCIPIPWLSIYMELLASDDDDDAASGEVFYDSENDEYYDY